MSLNIKSIYKGQVKDVLKNNLFYSGLSYGFKMFNNLIIFAFLARYFPVPLFGLIALLLVIVKLSETILDYGHKMIIVKELSVNKSLLDNNYISSKIAIKTVTLVLVTIAVLFYAYSNDFWGFNPIVIFGVISSGYFLSLSNINYSIFHSVGKFKLETISLLLLAVFLGICLVLSRFYSSADLFLIGYAISIFLVWIVSSYLVYTKIYPISFLKVISSFEIPKMIKEFRFVLPFATIVIIEALFASFDTILVERFCTQSDLGFFSGFKKIVAGLSIMMLICSSAIMPIISRMTDAKVQGSHRKIFYIFLILSFIGIFILIGYLLFDDFFVSILLGDKFKIVENWSLEIGLLTLTAYMKIVPGIYFITSNNENKRLFITLTGLILGSVILLAFLPGQNAEFAVVKITQVRVVMSLIYILVFLYVIYKDSTRIQKT